MKNRVFAAGGAMPAALPRRSILAGLVALPIATVPALAVEPHPDAALMGKREPYLALRRSWLAALDRFSAAEEAYYAAKPAPPVGPVLHIPEPSESISAVAWFRAARGEDDAAYQAAHVPYKAALAEHEAKLAELRARFKIDALNREVEVALAAVRGAEDDIAAHPVATIDGVIFKATVLGLDGDEHEFADAIFADLRQFAEGRANG